MSALGSGRLTYGGVSFLFGDGTPYPLTGFVRGVASWNVDDRDLPRRDGLAFGRDYKSGPTHELGLLVQGEGDSRSDREADTRARLGELAGVWSADDLRASNGVLAQLWIGDRCAYGRPREFTPDDSGTWDGVANPQLQFVAHDDLWYGPETITRVRFSTPETGGLMFPAEAPFMFDAEPGVRNGAVTVAGDMGAWPVFTIQGPVINPSITVTGVGTLKFDVTLAYDHSLVVDTRPWARWVKRNGAAFPGALSASGARLSDMRLLPGTHEVILRGTDPTGTGFLDVQVQPAYASL